ncbi:hypothetical protein [Methylomonas sp. YC3]
MKITITDIKKSDGNTVIFFCSSLGNGMATWASSEAPSKTYQYDVEIDIEKSIDQVRLGGSDHDHDHDHEYRLMLEGSSVIMNGTIESIEDDGMACYRLSQDCIIMIESGKSDLKKGDWVKLKLKCSDVEITDQGI